MKITKLSLRAKALILSLTFFSLSPMLLSSSIPDSYQNDLAAIKTHNFNKNQIKSFVYYWFSLHDRHVDIKKSYAFLDKDNLYMKFPEMEVKNLSDYKKWYDGVGKNIKSNLHYVKYLKVTFLEDHKYRVDVFVIWKAINKDGKFINMNVLQEWILTDKDSINHPFVQRYNIISFTPAS